MKHVVLALLAVVAPMMAHADLASNAATYQKLFNNPPDAATISKSKMNTGETRPKAVLKGVFYFGGSDVKRKNLSSGFQDVLCKAGFSQAYSVYTPVNTVATCSGNRVQYDQIGEAKLASDGGSKVAALMRQIYDIVKSDGGKGPIYLHCYYGVHASSTIAQMVLKQFCGISDAQALANWKKVNLYNSLDAAGVAKQQAKIKGYQVDRSLQLTAAEQATICY